MEYEIQCSVCGRSSQNMLDFKCHSCGEPLDIRCGLEFETRKIHKRNYSAWRYAEFFPYVKEADIVTLGEGWTPSVKFSKNILFKLENLNPTGSFKDRGSTTLISSLVRLIKERRGCISEDSSGNAGASIAAYAARAGLKAEIYVPERVAGPKFTQIQSYGAEVVRISGSRAKVAEEAQKDRKGRFYVGHILHPIFRDGIRTIAYEIAEQCNWHVPDRVYLPASAGTLLLGVLSGFRHMCEFGVIDDIPRIVACQTRQVSPLYHRFKNLPYKPPENVTSIADALVSVDPPLLDLMTKRLKSAEGDVAMVEEDKVLAAFKELAKSGFFVEPSSAVAYAAYRKQIQNEEVGEADPTVIILTGSGLKSHSRLD